MDYIYLLDLFGVFTFAVSGSVAAARRKLDLFGALFISFLTAVGGGTVRDVILGDTPVFWLLDPAYISCIALAVIIVFLFSSRLIVFRKIFILSDAIGIGVFTIIGMEKAMHFNLSPVFVIFMGVITAVLGGMLRDLFCNEIPLILRKEIYATSCIAGGIFFFILRSFGLHENIVVSVTIVFIIAVRLLSLRLTLSLPQLSLKKEK